MIPAGLKPLADMRFRGEVPADSVWLYVGDYEQPQWWRWSGAVPEVVISELAPVARLDLRPLVGLKVRIQADRYSEAVMRLADRCREYARSVDLFILAWLPDDIGLMWDRGADGFMPFGELSREASA